MKIVFILILFLTFSNAKDLAPNFVYEASGLVTDIVSENNKIYVSTDASSVDIFDLKTQKLIKQIKVAQIKDFMGDVIDSKIYNVDILNSKILFTSQANKGYREIHLFVNNKLDTIINQKKKMFISKAKIVDENTIIFALLSNELFLYDVKNQKNIWKISVSASRFSDFVLNEKKSKVVVADESGDLQIIDIKKGEIIESLSGVNLDNVFSIDYKNNKIITAGQDRKSVVYDLNLNKNYFMRAEFLIYSSALSHSANLGAYSSDEDNNVLVFNTNNKKVLYKLTNNLMSVSSILFLNENEVFVTTDSNKFNYYKLGDK